jgi:hypothetical protein
MGGSMLAANVPRRLASHRHVMVISIGFWTMQEITVGMTINVVIIQADTTFA